MGLNDNKTTVEEAFRSSLEDISTIVTELSGVFKTTEELLGAINLALVNDGQLALLMSLMKKKK